MRRRQIAVSAAVALGFSAAACSLLTLPELDDPPGRLDATNGEGATNLDGRAGLIEAAPDAPTSNSPADSGADMGCSVGPGAAACRWIATPTDAGLTGIYYSGERSLLFVASPTQGVFAVDPRTGESALIAATTAERVLGAPGTRDGHLFVATHDAGVVAIRLPLDGGTTVTTLGQELEPFSDGGNVAAIAVQLADYQETEEGLILWLQRGKFTESDGSTAAGLLVFQRTVQGDILNAATTDIIMVASENLPAELALQGPSSRSVAWASSSQRPLSDGGYAFAASAQGDMILGAGVVGAAAGTPLFFADDSQEELFLWVEAGAPALSLKSYTDSVQQILVVPSKSTVFYLTNAGGGGSGELHSLTTSDSTLTVSSSFTDQYLAALTSETPTRIDVSNDGKTVYVCSSAGHVFAVDLK